MNNMTGFDYDSLTQAMVAAPPDRPFVTMWRDEEDVQSATFGQFLRAAQYQAADFIAYGLVPGDRVILVMPQGIPLMVSFAAAMLIGAVPAIMAYPNFKVEPAKYRYGLSGVTKNLIARLIVLDEMFPDDLLGYIETAGGAKVVRNTDLRREASGCNLPTVHPDPGAIAFIQHSAGTTGLQKGVALSHRAVLTQLHHLVSAIKITGEDRIYSWLPLYHDMGLIACFMLPLVYHLPLVMQSPTDWVMQPGSMLSLITQYRCTLSWIPNFTLQFLARRVPAKERMYFDLSSLRMLINCSEPVREQSIQEFYTTYASQGVQLEMLQSCYAMAENVFAVTQSGITGSEKPARVWVDSKSLTDAHIAERAVEGASGSTCLVSSGRCIDGNRVLILSDDGLELPEGHVGEIVIQSDSLLEGYYNRPDLTAKAKREGWYWSGDLGFCLDEELYVIGRKSDLIIVAGKNLYPQDIEEITCSHPRIHDGRAVAFGMFNADLGTEEVVVVAEVEHESDIHNTSSIEQAVRNAIVAELGIAVRAVYLKPPKWIVKSTAGKPARATTREKLLAEQPELHGA